MTILSRKFTVLHTALDFLQFSLEIIEIFLVVLEDVRNHKLHNDRETDLASGVEGRDRTKNSHQLLPYWHHLWTKC